MSDPVTILGIEDVLSSIRRLVREGGGPANAAQRGGDAGTPPGDAAPDKAPDKAQFSDPRPSARFVLTPALRVAEAPHAPVATVMQPLPQGIIPHADALRALSGKDTPALDGFDFGRSDNMPADRLSARAVPTDLGQSDLAHSDLAHSDFADEDRTTSDFVTDEPASTITPDQPERGHRLAETAAGLEVALTGHPESWEPDGSEEVPVMDWSQTTPEDAPVFRSRQSAPKRQASALRSAPQDAIHVAAGDPGFRHIASPDQTAHQGGAAQPFSAGADDPDGVARFVSDSESGFEHEFASYLGRHSDMDEQALRAMIVDIVRQELQGSLGERITRNVRKLVRREITRMLTNDENY